MIRPTRLLPLSLLLACGGDPGATAPDAGDADGEDDACATLRAAFEPIVPTVMVVVDRSGSMREDYGGTSRWDALYETLMDDSTGIVAQLGDKVRFGMLLYSGDDTLDGGTCPTLHQVAPAVGNFAALEARYGALEPGHGTPTGAAMRAAAPALAAVNAPGPRLLVLATDGEPDTCGKPADDRSPAARGEVIDAVQAAHAEEMNTYVIGVGDAVSSGHLQDVANAGRGFPVDGPDKAAYYRALDADGLVEAFDEIVGGARGCVFEFDRPVGGVAAGGVVTLDGRTLAEGTEWELRDGGSIELLGAACDAVLAGGAHVVEASITCREAAPVE